MRIDRIERRGWRYQALRSWGWVMHRLCYSKQLVFNLPKSRPTTPHMIIVNHQNALMDALAIVLSWRPPVIFLARSDIFRKPRMASALYFLGIMPIYRIRDGYENLKNNDTTFRHTQRVLNYPRAVCILPEGSHAPVRRLRPLQKGFARMAFQNLEHQQGKKTFLIYPAGIDYENYEQLGTRLTVNYGEPFEAAEYFELYQQNPGQALTALRDRAAQELQRQMIHISSERHYDTILFLTDVNQSRLERDGMEASEIFAKNRKLATQLSAEEEASPLMEKLAADTQRYRSLTQKLAIGNHNLVGRAKLPLGIIKSLISILLLAISTPGFLFYGWFYALLRRVVTRKIKDPQFRTSVRVASYIVVLPLVAVLESLLALIAHPWPYIFATLGLTAVSGLVALRAWVYARKAWQQLKSSAMDLVGNRDAREALALRREIDTQLAHQENTPK